MSEEFPQDHHRTDQNISSSTTEFTQTEMLIENRSTQPINSSHITSEKKFAEETSAEDPLLEQPRVIFHHHPAEPPAKPRLFHNGRDISLSMIPLVLICLVIAALSGNLGVRFGPGRKQDQYPAYEASVAASAAATELPFSVRFPQLPQSWKPNSGSKDNVASSVIFNLGWLTPEQHYIQLSQSAASMEEMIEKFSEDHQTEITTPPAPGWKWFTVSGDKSFGVSHISGETLAIIGNRTTPVEYRIMIKAIERATPLNRV